jgi:uncharacterized membrane protein YkvI
MRFQWIDYSKALLGAVAGLFLSVLVSSLSPVFRSMSAEKATGLAAVAGGLIEGVLSPWFWISFLGFLSLFYVTGRLERRPLRTVFFWIPTVGMCLVGFGLWALFLYAMTHIRTKP